MKRTSNPEENAILISKKAYNDFTTRLRQTLGAIASCPESIDEAVDLLDRYVKGGITDLDSSDILVKVALMMLKPEIDKAMRRSSAARERAKLRREKSIATSSPSTKPDVNESQETSEPVDSSAERPMNRRARREYEHELAREQRRWERHLKRMRG